MQNIKKEMQIKCNGNMIFVLMVSTLGLVSFYGNEPFCFKDNLRNVRIKFGEINNIDAYFVFNDTSKQEIINGELFSKSKVVWKSCSAFEWIILTIKENPYLRAGDTLRGEFLKIKTDTVFYSLNFKGEQRQYKGFVTRQ